jgi:hypothetical protein
MNFAPPMPPDRTVRLRRCPGRSAAGPDMAPACRTRPFTRRSGGSSQVCPYQIRA